MPLDGDNIVDRAADLLAAHHGVARDRATCTITKAIPVAGGMAGGSADAAAALVALDRLWELETSDEDLLALAAQLGSDVPFALVGGTALGTGRGEVVTPVADHGTWWWVVVPSAGRAVDAGGLPPLRRALPRRAGRPRRRPTQLLAALASGDPHAPRRRAAQRPAGRRRSTCAPTWRADRARARPRARCAGWCPARARPACSSASPATTPARSPGPCSPTASTPVVLVANGPVAGAHVVSL